MKNWDKILVKLFHSNKHSEMETKIHVGLSKNICGARDITKGGER